MTNNKKPYRVKGEDGKFLSKQTDWSADHRDRFLTTTTFPLMRGKKTIALFVSTQYNNDDMHHEADSIVEKLNSYDTLVKKIEIYEAALSRIDQDNPILDKVSCLRHGAGITASFALAKAKRL